MLNVKTIEEVNKILEEHFPFKNECEEVLLNDAAGRISFQDIRSKEFVPSFNRSTVDGYAIDAKNSFGTSDASPSVLNYQSKVEMGVEFKEALKENSCIEVPTGGQVPEGANAVEMVEYSENYHDGTIGIMKPISPNSNIIFKGDDLKENDIVVHASRKLSAIDIASLASVGITKIKVAKKLSVGILSTGDELIDIDQKPRLGEIRNTNSILLSSLLSSLNCNFKDYGIIKDDEEQLSKAIDKAINENDVVLISGGSSAGKKDVTAKLLSNKGQLLFHGIALKPGKPTMAASIQGKAVFGLAGHPLAVLFCFILFVKPLLYRLLNAKIENYPRTAILDETIDSNQGRTSVVGLKLHNKDNELHATPIITKSGLITSLREIDAYTIVERDVEGLGKGTKIGVYDVI